MIDLKADSPLDMDLEPLEPLEQSELAPAEEPAKFVDSDPLNEAIDELQKSISDDELDGAARKFSGNANYNKSVFDVPVEVQVIIGSTSMSVSQLMAMEPDTVVTLDSKIGEPVDIAVNGKKIGEGELEINAHDPNSLCVRIVKLGS
ncbi:FliM/FliN family flagellar motor switch protein [Ahrensia kielensis]|uniref:FliM/FliN family flagellar motor switch protein n=1 Tax=Ahrensia kielensis TaxID=76980 RepID=UPI00036E88CA|nr:FliM/FliN family flagellar motor switch protein [Ahrensia kielensis]